MLSKSIVILLLCSFIFSIIASFYEKKPSKKYIYESRFINSIMNANINYYLKTDNIYNNFFDYSNVQNFSNERNYQMCQLIKQLKTLVLQNCKNRNCYNDVRTKKGIIRGIKVGTLTINYYQTFADDKNIPQKMGIYDNGVIDCRVWGEPSPDEYRNILMAYGLDSVQTSESSIFAHNSYFSYGNESLPRTVGKKFHYDIYTYIILE